MHFKDESLQKWRKYKNAWMFKRTLNIFILFSWLSCRFVASSIIINYTFSTHFVLPTNYSRCSYPKLYYMHDASASKTLSFLLVWMRLVSLKPFSAFSLAYSRQTLWDWSRYLKKFLFVDKTILSLGMS